MNMLRELPRPRQIVLGVTLALFLLWVALHLGTLTATQDGWIRFALTTAFGLLIVLRPKPRRTLHPEYAGAPLSVLACIPGVACVLMGLILHVQQIEWIGILLILWGCLRWSLPTSHRHDVFLALLLLYWAHPLPSQIFGPLQIAMQKMSVQGTEWLLVGCDVRVWADGLVLRTGFSTYEVPAWCSGMRTATTVFLLALGLGILNRFRWWECALTIVAALIQALLLNILRIALMVVSVPRIFDMSAAAFLHNTGGLIVIAAVFLVYGEISLLRRRHQRQLRPPPTEVDAHLEHAPDWLHLRSVRWVVLVGALLVAGLTLAVYRNGPGNRLAVLKDVATAAHDAENHEEAIHFAEIVLAADPSDTDWHLKKLRILLTLRRFEDVLTAADRMPELGKLQAHERNVLRAYALMALDRIDEAADIVRILPNPIRRANPRVAMILAVMAFRADDPAGVADNILLAARWKPNLERIRLMFPYLRQHRQWSAIADTDSTDPHQLPEAAFSAIEAFMNLDRIPPVARLTSYAMGRWPGDMRILEPLFFMSVKRTDSAWELRFREQLRLCADQSTDPDALFPLFEKCFNVGRPDLAWHVYRRLQSLDPQHPALAMALVRYGDQWFSFRRRSLGIPGNTPQDTLDLRAYFHAARQLRAWHPFTALIPEGDALSVDNILAARQTFLDRALAEFSLRADRHQLSPPMRYLQASALELAGRHGDARELLQRIANDIPGEARTARVALSEMFERLNDWQNVYETLRGFMDDPDAALTPSLRFGRATMNLRLGIMALHTAREICRRYPRSAQADALLATALLQTSAPDEALALLDSPRPRHIRELEVLRAQTLFMTQRYREVEEFCHTVLLSRPPIHADSPQRLLLPPAESAHHWHQFYVPTAAQFAHNAALLRENAATTASPFLKPLMTAWLNCHAAGGASNTTIRTRWEAIGRDNVERALALNQLTLLLCHYERFGEARDAAERACELLPASATLWRWYVSLSEADPIQIARARQACPDDPELWLAALIHTARTAPADVQTFLTETAATRATFPTETLARAGEFLRRHDLADAGARVLREATPRAAGSLPIYLQGLRTALAEEDREWATTCTKAAIACALRPTTSLYRQMIDIKTADGEPTADLDLIEALKRLCQVEPDNALWPQMLGYVRFKRGGWDVRDAFTQMSAALANGATNLLTFSIAAESARQLGNHERAVEILRLGLNLYPNDLEFLNNLATCLTQTPDGLPEAQTLLPRLEALHADDPSVLDTMAEIHVAAGDAAAARDLIERIRPLVTEGSTLWFRTHMHEARLLAATNALARAQEILETAARDASILPDEELLTANRLLAEWRSRRSDNPAVASRTNALQRPLPDDTEPTTAPNPADHPDAPWRRPSDDGL